jgi:glyoxylase-like metal-dependent hydrolase (beta-lactamase superfamily II)
MECGYEHRGVNQLRSGIWHWQARHPDWSEGAAWQPDVSSYAIELGDELVLFDPLAVPDELRARATAVVLTAPYHERDARGLGLPVLTPPADTWQDWVQKFGVDPEQVRGMESADLAWLRAGEGEGHFHTPGAWPFGIHAYAGREKNDLVLWLPSLNAIVSGDSLSDFDGGGLDIQLAGRKHVTRDDVLERLRPLLDLPVELVLPAHGKPADRAALERVLA